MGKVAKPKKREVSIHSRAARRGESPIPTAKSKSTDEGTDYKPWLHSVQDAGIAKKKKVKQLTRQQKLRQQRSMEKASSDLDKLEKKVADSKQRGKIVKARAADWEQLNEKLELSKGTAAKTELNGQSAESRVEVEEEEEAMDDTSEQVEIPSAQPAETAIPEGELDEIT